MRDGVIVQAGTPRDIYERPATRFAAEFIGNANILPGEIAMTRPDGTALVSLDQGRKIEGRFSSPANTPARGSVLVCVRSESIRIAESGADRNCFEATVAQANFLGSVVVCTLYVGSAILRAELPARSAPQAGSAIIVRIDPEDAILIIE
jgi:iron(III) transport system ATP-binding protein